MNIIKSNKDKFKKIKVMEIIKVIPAANYVANCLVKYQNYLIKTFIKVERSKLADFASEIRNLTIINDKALYNKSPLIYESGIIKEKYYLVLEAKNGRRLSEVLKKSLKYKNNYLFKYGKELALIHNLNPNSFLKAKQRIINDTPQKENYTIDNNLQEYINYLNKTKPSINHDTFIHGDFHYANVLWKNGNISGVIDWEYSGKGFKEQDIAWALIPRVNQKFMTNIKDMNMFLKGYKMVDNYNKEALNWCLINGCLHFYLMSKNKVYKNRLIKTINKLMDGNLI